MSYGVYVLIVYLILNTRIILKKEQRSLKHVLALILAVVLIVFVVTTRFVDFSQMPFWVQALAYAVYALFVYYFLHLFVFLVSVMLANCARPRKEQDYLIVLGAWVNKGMVTPLLAKRIDKAIEFYRKQAETHTPPKLVMSGGQGPGESRPEAVAMRAYALEKGIPKEHILVEKKSTSTLENMKFSKKVMDRDSGEATYRCIFVTNNYHVFRAGILAQKAGLKIEGIGSRTAFYYLFNAVLREYLAYQFLHLRWNIAFSACVLIIGFGVPFVIHLIT